MKNLLSSIFILISVNSFGQKVDSVKNALQVVPIQINALTKDSVFQLTWNVFGLGRDTLPATSYIQLYDRKGKKVQEMNVTIPYSVLKVWDEDIVVDNYILLFLGLKKR